MSHPALSPDALQLLLRELEGMAAQFQRDPSYDGTLTLNAADAFALVKLFSEFGTPKRSGGMTLSWLREHYILPEAKKIRADNPEATYAEIADAIREGLAEGEYERDMPEGVTLASVDAEVERLLASKTALPQLVGRLLKPTGS